MLFAAYLFTQKLAHDTSRRYLAAIWYDQMSEENQRNIDKMLPTLVYCDA